MSILKIKYRLLSILYKSTAALICVFVLIVIVKASGQVARWDLLEQVSMADNYFKVSRLYPPFDSLSPTGVSVYFPGVAILAILLTKLGADFYLVELMLLIACGAVFLFLFIQIWLVKEISGLEPSWQKFAPIAIFFALILTPTWLVYAIEFKPDTAALLVGFLGLGLAGFLRPNVKTYNIVFGAILCGSAIILKQQYISFILGLILFVLINPSRVRMLFLLVLSLVTSLILIYFYSNSDILFWNVKVLADDGFLSIPSIIAGYYQTITILFFSVFICFVILALGKNNIKDGRAVDMPSMQMLLRSPWIWVVVPSVLAAFASSAKHGGNSGNVQLGIILILPLVLVLICRIERWIFIGIAWIAVFSALPSLYSGPKNYFEANQLRVFVSKDLLNKPSVVLTGSDVYFASRVYRSNAEIINYWAVSVRDGTNATSVLPDILSKINPDRLVVENWPENKIAILADSRYKLVFENKIGLVASRQP